MTEQAITARSVIRAAIREQLERSLAAEGRTFIDCLTDELLNAITRPELAMALRVLACRAAQVL